MSRGLRVSSLEVRLARQGAPALHDLSLELAPGEVVGLKGRSGSGKTTLLHAIAGVLPWSRPAEVRGVVAVDGEDMSDLDPGQRAHLLATCLDTPDAQLFLATPAQELAAGRRLRPVSPHLDRVADAMGVTAMRNARLLSLSSGQRQRTALATTLAASPRPVLLDEPTAHLDNAGVAALGNLLAELADEGGSFLLTEQAGWRLGDTVDRWLELCEGRLVPCEAPRPPRLEPGPAPTDELALAASAIRVRRGDRVLLEGASLALRRGEVVWLSGANGAGKSSLLRALAGHRAAVGATLTWAAPGPPRRLGLALPVAELQLFARTVGGELALTGLEETQTGTILRRHRLDLLAGRAPWTLSRGERQRLVHATLDALDPEVVLLDEPGQGLDEQDLTDLADLVRKHAQRGRSYLIASHRTELAGLAHRHLRIERGQLLEVPG